MEFEEVFIPHRGPGAEGELPRSGKRGWPGPCLRHLPHPCGPRCPHRGIGLGLDALRWEKTRQRGISCFPLCKPLETTQGACGPLMHPGDARLQTSQGNPMGARTPPWSLRGGFAKGGTQSKVSRPLLALCLLSGDAESRSLPQERNSIISFSEPFQFRQQRRRRPHRTYAAGRHTCPTR